MKPIQVVCAFGLAFFPVGGIHAWGGDGADSIGKDAHPTVRDAGRFAGEKKDDYLRGIRKDLDDLKSKTNSKERELAHRTEKFGRKSGDALRREIRGLKAQEKNLEAKVQRAKQGGDRDLDHWKSEIDRGLENLKQSYNQLLDHMKAP